MKASAECIPTKLKTKNRVPWKTLTVRKKKRENVKTASLYYEINPTNFKDQKLKKEKIEIIIAYQKEQLEYIQSHLNKIRNLVEDRKSGVMWQSVNKGSKGKTSSRANLESAS